MPPTADGKNPGGIDHNYVVRGWKPDGSLRSVALLRDPASGRTLEILTDQPGIQVYTGNYLDGSVKGKGGVAYGKQAAVCLETQKYPDSIHHPDWPTPGSIRARPTGTRWSTGSAPARRCFGCPGFGFPISRRRTFALRPPGYGSLELRALRFSRSMAALACIRLLPGHGEPVYSSS